MIRLENCPITGSNKTQLLSSYDISVTSDSRIVEANVENRISKASGIIFNATGPRGSEAGFYTDEYDLHNENSFSEFMIYNESGGSGIYSNIVDFISAAVDLPRKGRVLDIGCGKGLLLHRFASLFPKWELHGIEPSRNAHKYFARVMPQVKLFNGSLEESMFAKEKFDLVLANGVLEHVPFPAKFLEIYRSCINKGVGYIGVPNFQNNPADLFTFDHLSRFTPQTIESLFATTGFSVISKMIPDSRVPMWYMIQPGSEEMLNADDIYEKSLSLARNSKDFADSIFSAYSECHQNALESNGRIGMYGTGTIGLLATQYSSLKPERLTAIFDDNSTIWGAERLGVKVQAPEQIENLGITHMVMSANPCYLPTIRQKIQDISPSIKIYG